MAGHGGTQPAGSNRARYTARPASCRHRGHPGHTAQGYAGQVTLKGYDNMTGLGTPNGQYFISSLRGLEK